MRVAVTIACRGFSGRDDETEHLEAPGQVVLGAVDDDDDDGTLDPKYLLLVSSIGSRFCGVKILRGTCLLAR